MPVHIDPNDSKYTDAVASTELAKDDAAEQLLWLRQSPEGRAEENAVSKLLAH